MAQVLKGNVKEKIIMSAIEEFLENGYENSTTRKIATKAGMTVGNLYRYYPNKESLYLDVIGEANRKLEIMLDEILGSEICDENREININLEKIVEMEASKENVAKLFVEKFDKYIDENREEFLIMAHRDCKEIQSICDHFEEFISTILGMLDIIKGSSRNDYNIYDYVARGFVEGFIYLVQDYDNEFKSRLKVYIEFYFENGGV